MIDSDKIFDLIEQSNKILLLSHRNPDADTLGSAGAFAFYLNSINKDVAIGNPNNLPTNLEFFNIQKFYTDSTKLDLTKFDLIITFDCGDTTQTGIVEKYLAIRSQVPTVNIDHHQTNPYYADVNIIEPVGATAEIVYKIFKKHNIKTTKEISTLLLTGIITDTNYFTNAGTTKNSMAIASDLLRCNANSKLIIKNTWKKNSPESLKVWGKILSKLQYNEKYKIVTAVISQEDSIMGDVFEGLANFLTTLYEANIIIVAREDGDGQIKCSLRTTKDNIDVSKLAQKFGGGGHAKAAGFSFAGKLERSEKGWRVIQN